MSKLKSLYGAVVLVTVTCGVASGQSAGRYTLVQDLPVCESFGGWQRWVKDPSSPPSECYAIPAGTTISVLGIKAGSVAIELINGPVQGHSIFAISPERWDYMKPLQ